MSVVHAELQQANARWEALDMLHCRMDCRIKSGNDEGKNERKGFGGETPTDARLFCRGIGHGRACKRQAHIYRRSTAVLVPRSLSSLGFCFLGRGLSVEWALPTPAYPSPAKSSRPSRSVRGLMPNAARERVASPRHLRPARARSVTISTDKALWRVSFMSHPVAVCSRCFPGISEE